MIEGQVQNPRRSDWGLIWALEFFTLQRRTEGCKGDTEGHGHGDKHPQATDITQAAAVSTSGMLGQQSSRPDTRSPGRVLFISACIVLHLFCEERNQPTAPWRPSHQPAGYSVHRWPPEGWGCLQTAQHHPAALGLGVEAFWPGLDSS